MKKFWPVAVLVVAGLMLALGVLFLCASIQEPKRLPLTLILLGGGGGLAGWSGVALRRMVEQSPERLAERITALARVGGGAEATLAQVIAELHTPHEATLAALRLLEGRRECYREFREEREVYVFPGLLPSISVRRCIHCGSQFSIKHPVYKCPHCGGVVEVEKQ